MVSALTKQHAQATTLAAMRAHPDSAEVQEEACLVLYNLAYDRENYRQVNHSLSIANAFPRAWLGGWVGGWVYEGVLDTQHSCSRKMRMIRLWWLLVVRRQCVQRLSGILSKTTLPSINMRDGASSDFKA